MLASGLGKSWRQHTETIAKGAKRCATTAAVPRQLGSTVDHKDTLLRDQEIPRSSLSAGSTRRLPLLGETGLTISSQPCRYHSTAPRLAKAGKIERTPPMVARLRYLSRNLKTPAELGEAGDVLDSIYNETASGLKMGTIIGLVQACIEMKSYVAADAAERYLLKMLEFHKAGRLDEPPKPQFFGLVFQAWVSSGDRRAGRRAEQMLDGLLKLEQQGELPVKVEAPKYSKVIYAYAMNGDLKNAQKVFLRCRNAFESGNRKARLDKFSWNALLHAHAKSGQPTAWSAAEKLFANMKMSFRKGILVEPPDSVTYNALIDVCGKCYQPERADHWLEEMCEHYRAGNRAVQPSTWSFNSTLNAWCQSPSEEGGQKCESILDTMIELAEQTGLRVRPDTISYNTVMMAFAKRGLPRDAERIFERQKDDYNAGNKSASADVRNYNTLIHAWVVANEDVSGEQAERILDHVVDLHNQGTLGNRPNFHTYIKVVNAWAETGKPDEASRVFDRLFDDYKNQNNTSAYLDPTVFKSMLLMYGSSGAPNAGELADKLLQQMSQLQYLPDVKLHLIPMIRCWRVSERHAHPKAVERIKAIQAVINRMQANDQQFE